MGFMNWLMKGVGFEDEQVYDDSVEKQKTKNCTFIRMLQSLPVNFT